MGTVFAECWKCDQCSHKWLKSAIYPSHCAKCRSRRWDSDKLTEQLKASLVVTPQGQEISDIQFENRPMNSGAIDIHALRDICAGRIVREIDLGIDQVPGQIAKVERCDYTEYSQELGETMACGLAQHSMKQKHGNWKRVIS